MLLQEQRVSEVKWFVVTAAVVLLQKRAIRLVNKAGYYDHTNPLKSPCMQI